MRVAYEPGKDIQEFTSFAADITIKGRHIEVITSGGGALVLEITDPQTGTKTNRTLTVYDHWQKALEFTKIIASGTTVTKVQVMT